METIRKTSQLRSELMADITKGETSCNHNRNNGGNANAAAKGGSNQSTMPHSPLIRVTEPTLAPLEGIAQRLIGIWADRNVTNQGPYARELESALTAWLGITGISLVSSGTAALMLALAAFDMEGEVITTPFTFVATTHAIRWAGLRPVFADIDYDSMTLDPIAVRHAITDRTVAILDVHLFGRPGHVEELAQLASEFQLKLLFDGAHAFGVRDEGGSILRHGDATAVSFHATKVFNTIEGGAIVASDMTLLQKISRLRNFGLEDKESIGLVGLNAKMNEVQASIGLANLIEIDAAIAYREVLHNRYIDRLAGVRGVVCPKFPGGHVSNYAYFPIMLSSLGPRSRDSLRATLSNHGIQSRSYGFPLLSEHAAYMGLASAEPDNLRIAHSVSSQVLCLPLHTQLRTEDIDRVCDVIASGG
jgi:dTDP-4-amino-4,6-dideoxygalactose transaminase